MYFHTSMYYIKILLLHHFCHLGKYLDFSCLMHRELTCRICKSGLYFSFMWFGFEYIHSSFIKRSKEYNLLSHTKKIEERKQNPNNSPSILLKRPI